MGLKATAAARRLFFSHATRILVRGSLTMARRSKSTTENKV